MLFAETSICMVFAADREVMQMWAETPPCFFGQWEAAFMTRHGASEAYMRSPDAFAELSIVEHSGEVDIRNVEVRHQQGEARSQQSCRGEKSRNRLRRNKAVVPKDAPVACKEKKARK